MIEADKEEIFSLLTDVNWFVARQKESPEQLRAIKGLEAIARLCNRIETSLDNYKDWHSDEEDSSDTD